MSHTPGPWRAIHEPAREYSGIHDNGGYRIDADGVEQLAFVWALNNRVPADGGPQENGPRFGAAQAEANACLIAAAPDMLVALQAIGDARGGVQLNTREIEAYRLVDAAIAKAIGDVIKAEKHNG